MLKVLRSDGSADRGVNPPSELFFFFACQFENSCEPAFSVTLSPLLELLELPLLRWNDERMQKLNNYNIFDPSRLREHSVFNLHYTQVGHNSHKLLVETEISLKPEVVILRQKRSRRSFCRSCTYSRQSTLRVYCERWTYQNSPRSVTWEVSGLSIF